MDLNNLLKLRHFHDLRKVKIQEFIQTRTSLSSCFSNKYLMILSPISINIPLSILNLTFPLSSCDFPLFSIIFPLFFTVFLLYFFIFTQFLLFPPYISWSFLIFPNLSTSFFPLLPFISFYFLFITFFPHSCLLGILLPFFYIFSEIYSLSRVGESNIYTPAFTSSRNFLTYLRHNKNAINLKSWKKMLATLDKSHSR